MFCEFEDEVWLQNRIKKEGLEPDRLWKEFNAEGGSQVYLHHAQKAAEHTNTDRTNRHDRWEPFAGSGTGFCPNRLGL